MEFTVEVAFEPYRVLYWAVFVYRDDTTNDPLTFRMAAEGKSSEGANSEETMERVCVDILER